MVGLLLSATEPYSLYPPNITCMVNREVVGIVTQINEPKADPERAARWLRLSGCKKIFTWIPQWERAFRTSFLI